MLSEGERNPKHGDVNKRFIEAIGAMHISAQPKYGFCAAEIWVLNPSCHVNEKRTASAVLFFVAAILKIRDARNMAT